VYEKQYCVGASAKTLDHSQRQRGGDTLDMLHQAAKSGRMSRLLNVCPTADPVQLRYWAETNGYDTK